jgi:sortase A
MDFFRKLRAGRIASAWRGRRALSFCLIVIGMTLLVYVGLQYWGMYRSQQKLEVQWEHQAAVANVPGVPKVNADDLLTRVVIPKINLDAIVVEGVSRKMLNEGPGHIKDTAAPGEPGNAVISAHRDTFFRHIYELNKGDEILVKRSGKVFHYQVTGKKIVMPDDVAVLKQTVDPQLTLITCYPTYYIGPAPKRLVVFSKLVQSEGDTPKQAMAQGAQ